MPEPTTTGPARDVRIREVRAFGQADTTSRSGLPAWLERLGAHGPASLSAADGPLVFWVGPQRWWLVGDAADGGCEEIDPARASSVELRAGRQVIRVAGDRARIVLSTSCGLDLRPSAFPAGRHAMTTVARVAVLLHARPDDGSFDLYVPRSFAAHVSACLRDAAAGLTC